MDLLHGGATIHLLHTDPPYNVRVEPRSRLCRNVARLYPPLSVPDADGVRIVLVVRLRDERQPAAGREGVLLYGVESV